MKKQSIDDRIKQMVVLIDTREQQPYKFPNHEIQGLKTGDYSIEFDGKSYENEVVIERKGNVSEIYSAAGSGRERFERELERLAVIPNKFILAEFDYMDLVNAQPPGLLDAQSVYGSIIKWHLYYGVPFIFCKNRVNARSYMYKYFYNYVKWKILKAGTNNESD